MQKMDHKLWINVGKQVKINYRKLLQNLIKRGKNCKQSIKYYEKILKNKKKLA